MKINSETIKNLNGLKVNERRNVLFNGLVYPAVVVELKSVDCAVVEFKYLDGDLKIILNKSFIYTQLP